jgi:hypothetical protein
MPTTHLRAPEADDGLFEYWRHFASSQHEVSGARVLQNPRLPIVEANAAYLADPTQVGPVLGWFESVERPPCLITPFDEAWDLLAAQFVRSARALQQLAPSIDDDHGLWVEQASWSAADAIAAVVLDGGGLGDWRQLAAIEFGRVVRESPDAAAYLAFEGDRAVGALVRIGAAAHLISALAGSASAVREALISRAAAEWGAALTTSEPLPGMTLSPGLTCVIWTPR